MSAKIYKNGAWVDIKEPKIYSGGGWKTPESIKKYGNGTWQSVWENYGGTISFQPWDESLLDRERCRYTANKSSAVLNWRGHGDVNYSHHGKFICNLSKTITVTPYLSIDLNGFAFWSVKNMIGDLSLTDVRYFNGGTEVYKKHNTALEPAINYDSSSYSGKYINTPSASQYLCTFNKMEIDISFLAAGVGHNSEYVEYTSSNATINGNRLKFI